MDKVAKKMSKADALPKTTPPQKGERYRCARCGMEIEVTAGCSCPDGEHVLFECCGQAMAKV